VILAGILILLLIEMPWHPRYMEAMTEPGSMLALGQAAGPVVYGLGLSSGIGIVPVLLTGAVLLTLTGWTCASQLRHEAARPEN